MDSFTMGGIEGEIAASGGRAFLFDEKYIIPAIRKTTPRIIDALRIFFLHSEAPPNGGHSCSASGKSIMEAGQLPTFSRVDKPFSDVSALSSSWIALFAGPILRLLYILRHG